jgi:hypothetical protein
VDPYTLQNFRLDENGLADPETLQLMRYVRDLQAGLHQTMVILGSRLEHAVAALVRSWLPSGLEISIGTQVYRRDEPAVRSRSLDLAVHRPLDDPRGFQPGLGWALIPSEALIVAIQIKSRCSGSDLRELTKDKIYNLANNETRPQIPWMGAPTVVLAASCIGDPKALEVLGTQLGISAFCLARWSDDRKPVVDPGRVQTYTLVNTEPSPLQRFKSHLLRACTQATGG